MTSIKSTCDKLRVIDVTARKNRLDLVSSVMILGAIALLLTACEKETANVAAQQVGTTTIAPAVTAALTRWYSQAQVTRGAALFQENCATCHKPDASGTPNWRERDAQGKLPPPPLNGTAHAWHHPLPVLRRAVRLGGVPLGGSMPGFAAKLNDQQIDDILAWVQTHWTDEIYKIWLERNNAAATTFQPPNKG